MKNLPHKKRNFNHFTLNERKLSIEQRPVIINERKEFGHWEGDCVVDKNCNSIFVLTERLTRYGLMIKLKHLTSDD